MIVGYITLVCFILLVIKYPLRKLGLNKANAYLMKIHEPASCGVVLGGLFLFVKGLIKNKGKRPISIIFGIIAYVVDFVLITACHITKNPTKKMRDHRMFSLLASIFTFLHTVCVIRRK